MLPVDIVVAIPPSFVGLAALVAVIRAKKEDLPEIVRALMRIRAKDGDGEKGPPALPEP